MNLFIKIVDRIFNTVCVICRVLLLVIFGVMWIVVFGRYFLGKTPIWGEELVLFSMLWISMLSGADALRRDAHLRITIIDKYLSPKALLILQVVLDALVLVFCSILLRYAITTLPNGFGLRYQGMKISEGWAYLSIPVGFLLLIVADLERLLKHVMALAGKAAQTKEETEA